MMERHRRNDAYEALRDALELAAGQFKDLGDLIEEGKSPEAGVLRASSERCQAAITLADGIRQETVHLWV